LFFTFTVVAIIREPNVEGRIDEDHVAHDVPGGVEDAGHSLVDSDGTHLGECSELGAGTGPALEPDHEGHILGGSVDIVTGCTEEIVEHACLALGIVPINFLIACVRGGLPE
jgi:hypothetical protein